MTNIFTHKNFNKTLNFNNLGLHLCAEILERERERERERETHHRALTKQNFLLCQNNGTFFYVFVCFVVYIHFQILSWQGRLCPVGSLLFCCRSNTTQDNRLCSCQLLQAAGCSVCTLLLYFRDLPDIFFCVLLF